MTEENYAPGQVDVVGAVILANGRVLAARRGASMSLARYWEFPGGKIELDEDPQAALRREVLEELGCEIEVGPRIETTRHEYSFGTVMFTSFWATIDDGEPIASEHSELRWCTPNELSDLRWAPADLPTVERVRTLLETNST